MLIASSISNSSERANVTFNISQFAYQFYFTDRKTDNRFGINRFYSILFFVPVMKLFVVIVLDL